MQRVSCLFLLVVVCMLAGRLSSVCAQEMRVYTTLHDLRDDRSTTVRSHSLTLFHGGKVYDYLEEAGEVVIFEPVHHRFVLLGKNYTATEVSFTEINQILESETARARSMSEKMFKEGNADDKELAKRIQWLMAPTHEKNFDIQSQTLSMVAVPRTYHVKTAQASTPEYARLYLDYADWAARLNCAIRLNGLPQFRIQLNEYLREGDMLPVQVDLIKTFPNSNRKDSVRAEHKFSFDFQSTDRRHISHWENQLKSSQVKWVPFAEYNQR